MDVSELNQELGNADLFLIDQILKGRFTKNMKILDAGCGEGRNLTYFIKNNYNITGIDKDESSIRMLKFIIKNLNPNFDTSNFQIQSIENNLLDEGSFDIVLCFSVLHFSENSDHFFKLFEKLLHTAVSDGVIFISMESSFGAEENNKNQQHEKSMNPTGDVRFLLNESLLDRLLSEFSVKLVEPVKYDIIKGFRSMTYLMLQKITMDS